MFNEVRPPHIMVRVEVDGEEVASASFWLEERGRVDVVTAITDPHQARAISGTLQAASDAFGVADWKSVDLPGAFGDVGGDGDETSIQLDGGDGTVYSGDDPTIQDLPF